MTLGKKYVTRYGTFYDELNEEDIMFYEMTEEEFDERANRLMYKALNGIRDNDVIEAEKRMYRNWLLRYGEEEADLKLQAHIEMFED